MTDFDTDYLIIGAGAAGLSFADTLLDHSDATITIVDRRARPGGHWNDAYGFVALHQPSSYYGVPSLPLGSGQIDTHGFNAGYCELASGPEVSAYFDAVMRRRLLPSGRVRYLPMHEVRGDGLAVSLLTGAETRIGVQRRTVDTSFYAVSVPATTPPKFRVAAGVDLVPPGDLPGLWQRQGAVPRHFTVIGAGKTGMDTVYWLLAAGVAADAIRWIVPRDSWVINRSMLQQGDQFFRDSIGGLVAQFEAAAAASDAADFFERLEQAGFMMRIDPQVRPEMCHYAVISPGEMAQLRTVSDVVRLGRVTALEPNRIVLQHGTISAEPDTLFIDCSASAYTPRAAEPVFSDRHILLQFVRMPLTTFSAALIAWVEANVADDAARNALCRPIDFPDTITFYPGALLGNMQNQALWSSNPALIDWIHNCRLDLFSRMMSAAAASGEPENLALLQRYKASIMPGVAGLHRLAAPA